MGVVNRKIKKKLSNVNIGMYPNIGIITFLLIKLMGKERKVFYFLRFFFFLILEV